MNVDHKPLYALTIGEYITLTKTLINEAITEKGLAEQQFAQQAKEDEHYTIKGLCAFLHCSKVSIHKYKKIGLPYYRLGRKILFKKQEVLNFMKGLKSKRVIIS
jgi:hypothetical protein